MKEPKEDTRYGDGPVVPRSGGPIHLRDEGNSSLEKRRRRSQKMCQSDNRKGKAMVFQSVGRGYPVRPRGGAPHGPGGRAKFYRRDWFSQSIDHREAEVWAGTVIVNRRLLEDSLPKVA